jgi:hypothetical protein
VSDLLSRPDGDWLSCSGGGEPLRNAYSSQLQAILGSGIDVDVTSVAFWDGATFGPTCDETNGHRLQRLTVLATQDDVTEQLFVVKRPPPDETPSSGTVVPDHYESTFAWNSGTTTTTTTTTVPSATTTTVPSATTTTTVPATTTTVPSATTTTTTTPPTDTVTCDFSITESWGSGGKGQLYITNNSSSSISGWTVKIQFGSGSMSLWNVGTQSSSGGSQTATNLSWNGYVGAGATTNPTGGSVERPVSEGDSLPCEVVSTS